MFRRVFPKTGFSAVAFPVLGMATPTTPQSQQQQLRLASSSSSLAAGIGMPTRVNLQRYEGMRANRDVAGTFFQDADIPGLSVDPEEEAVGRGVILKHDSTLISIWADVLKAWPTRRFVGTKMWVRGRLGYVWATFESLNQEVEAMRHMLHGMGVEKGSRVAVISDNRYEWVVMMFATLQLGATYVPIPTNVTPQEAQLIVKSTRARVLCVETQNSYASVKGWIGVVGELRQVMCFEDQRGEASYAIAVTIADDVPPEERIPICDTIRQEDTAMIMFTAGTTGSPKGVMLSHKALVANISSCFGQFGESISHEDIFMSLCPWTIAGALTMELFQVILKGCSMCIPPEVMEGFSDLTTVNPTVVISPALPFQRCYNNIVDEILTRKITKQATRMTVGAITQSRVMMTKPSIGIRTASQFLLGKFKSQFGTDLRLVVIIGHQLLKDQGELLADLDLFVVNTYGCLEAGGILATDMDVPSKLKALPGVELRVVNDQNEVVVPGDIGEILVEAPHAMQGYFDIHIDEVESANSLVVYGNRTFVRTGDYGSLNGGWVTVKGHKDILITLQEGKVVDPLEIEALVAKSPFIKQIFVFGDRRPYLTALIVPLSQSIANHLRKIERRDGIPIVNEREKADCVRAELRRVSQNLPPRSQIRRFAFVDEFTQANGFITSKMGYARQKIETHYVHYINQLYDDSPKFYGFAVDDYDDLF